MANNSVHSTSGERGIDIRLDVKYQVFITLFIYVCRNGVSSQYVS
jgi:hypothetical protein